MLDWVMKNQHWLEVVLKPHPMLFESMAHGKMPPVEFEAFLNAWVAQANTSIVLGGDYGPLFAASDLMITDGVTFLVEYQLFDKPLIWIDSEQHVGFNEMGELACHCLYRATSVREVSRLVDFVLSEQQDPLAEARREVSNVFRPFPGESAERVVATIHEKLLEEASLSPDRASV
jgi:CDP-glycerol glycerophosphotransferase (TagB/SpsB family)